MEKVSFYITDSRKLKFLYDLLKSLDFVILPADNKNKTIKEYDFFKSAGLWKDRNINQDELRSKAWKRSK